MTLNSLLTLWNAWAVVWANGLLRACVQGGIALLLVWGVCRLWAKMPPPVRPWLWRLAYLKLLLAFVWAVPVSLPLLPPAPEGISSPLSVASSPAPATPAQNVSLSEGSTPADQPSTPPALPAEAPAALLFGAPGWLMLVWVVGLVWCLARIAGEWTAAEWLRRLAEPVLEETLNAVYLSLGRKFGLNRPPYLRQTESAGSPVLLGGANPTIILPAALLTQCGTEELELILAHELAHRKRNDLVWGWLPALAHSLFFFFPIEWLAAREYRLAQEMACDALALEITRASVSDYGETLVKVATQRRPNLQSRLVTVGIVEAPGELKRRLLAMKGNAPFSSRRLALAASLLLLLTLVGCVPWQLTARAAGNPKARKPPLNPGYPRPGAATDLRYGWKAGQSYVYAVKIESEEADYTETITGNAVYTVRAADADSITLTCRGSLFPHRRTHDGRPVLGSGLLHLNYFGFGGLGHHGGPFGNPNEIRIDPTGHILATKGGTDLPRALGDLTQLVVEPLGETDSWEVTGGCVIVLQEIRPITPHSHFGRTETTNLPASERTAYKLGTASGNTVPIQKHYELRTNESIFGHPRLAIEGDGEITFDTQAGLPKAMEFKVTLTEQPDRNTTVRTPVTVTYRLLEGAEREKVLNPPPAPKVERKPLTDTQRQQALADLQASDNFKKMNAANLLAQAAPDGNRAAVAKSLETILNDKDGFVRTSAAKALTVWGGRENVPAMIKRLDDESFTVRWAALEALAAWKDPRAAAPVAAALKKDRGQAIQTLQAIGPVAAPAVVPYLKDKDWGLQMDVCKLLKIIGSSRQIPALQEAARNDNGLVKMSAEEAIKVIKEREGKGE